MKMENDLQIYVPQTVLQLGELFSHTREFTMSRGFLQITQPKPKNSGNQSLQDVRVMRGADTAIYHHIVDVRLKLKLKRYSCLEQNKFPGPEIKHPASKT